MANPSPRAPNLDHFFSSSAARLDRWRELNAKAQTWAADARGGKPGGGRAAVEAALAEVRALEDFFAYPGLAADEDAGRAHRRATTRSASARLVRRISGALLSGQLSLRRAASGRRPTKRRQRAGPHAAASLTAAKHAGPISKPCSSPRRRPPACRKIAKEIRRLRRVEDAMVYEPVLVGSFEDAMLGTIMNGKIEAVVIFDGIPMPSQHDVPLLRDFLTTYQQLDTSSLAPREVGVTLARLIKRIRPELDIYLLTDRERGEAGRRPGGLDDPARVLRSRGVDGGASQHPRRRRRPLLHAAFRQSQEVRRPTDRHVPRAADRARQVDHEVELDPRHGRVLRPEPVPRGDAPPPTGGLDSMLEPTGNIKIAQEKFARAVGADHVFFVTNGTSTSNKMVYQAVTKPGDIVIADRNCHKSHHYGMVLSGAQPLYVEAFPMTEYSMYGAVPLRTIKQALLESQGRGTARSREDGDAHQLHVRRTRLQHAPGDGRVPGDQAGSAFSCGTRRGSVSRAGRRSCARAPAWARPPRLKNGARRPRRWRRIRRRPPSSARISTRRIRGCSIGAWFPTRARCASACTRPTRCTSRCRACARARSSRCADEDYNHHVSAFREAVFIHASTSPNAQIIASLDVARRQMELEGYELVMRSIEIALAIRREVAEHPIISKYFRVLGADAMIPAEFRASGFHGLPHAGQQLGDRAEGGDRRTSSSSIRRA